MMTDNEITQMFARAKESGKARGKFSPRERADTTGRFLALIGEGLKQEQVATKFGCNKSLVSNWIRWAREGAGELRRGKKATRRRRRRATTKNGHADNRLSVTLRKTAEQPYLGKLSLEALMSHRKLVDLELSRKLKAEKVKLAELEKALS